jgi:hypothetical protein
MASAMYDKARRTFPDMGTLILDFSTSRNVSQQISIHYKSHSLRYSLIAEQNRLKQKIGTRSNGLGTG